MGRFFVGETHIVDYWTIGNQYVCDTHWKWEMGNGKLGNGNVWNCKNETLIISGTQRKYDNGEWEIENGKVDIQWSEHYFVCENKGQRKNGKWMNRKWKSGNWTIGKLEMEELKSDNWKIGNGKIEWSVLLVGHG